MFEAASVHGRFQPFHNEHLEYALAAKQECDFLWVGITQFDVSPDDANPLARHRQRPENNPFTYFERIMMIAAFSAGNDKMTRTLVNKIIQTKSGTR